MGNYRPFLDDDVPMGEIGLEIDEDGNIHGIFDDEAELPPLPGATGHEAQVFQEQLRDAGESPRLSKQGHDVVIMGEQTLPNASAFPSHPVVRHSSSSSTPNLFIPTKPQRRPRKCQVTFDQNIQISREELRSWSNNYVSNMERLRNDSKVTSLAQSKKNALAFLYGKGIANVGAPVGDYLIHPLAEDFSGNLLRARLHGRGIEDVKSTPSRGRRRGRSEAFADD